ncbi:MAG: hypothetical protein V3U17_00130 [Thermoplasmata archaeon]
MDAEGAFNVSLRRRALRSLSISEDGDGESEVSGSIGRVRDVDVVDNALLEVHGSLGTLRLSLPRRFLEPFRHRSNAKGE